MKEKCLAIILPVLLSGCINKEELKNEIKEEIKEECKQEIKNKVTKIEKGDGFRFYNEQINIGKEGYYIHHSTLKCPYIKHGVQRNFCYSNRQDLNLYCSKCMDDELISMFENRYFPSKSK